MRTIIRFAIASFALLALAAPAALSVGCSAAIPDGRYACDRRSDCPPGLGCRFESGTGLCSRDLPCIPGELCDDGSYCNGPDICTAEAVCTFHTVPPCTAPSTCSEELDSCCRSVCDDGNPCTDDTGCGPDACVYTVVEARACEDGAFCDGADTCGADGACSAHGGSPCAAGVTCDEGTKSCLGVVCGGLGDPCCDLTCADGVCDGTSCVACGRNTEPCCAGSVCDAGLLCGNTGVCAPPCGAEGQGCCTDGSPECGAALACVGGICVCGALGQLCCGGTTCAPNLTCGGDGVCACGGPGQPCCGGSACNAATLRCYSAAAVPYCTHCGAQTEICCEGAVPCEAGSICIAGGAEGTCGAG